NVFSSTLGKQFILTGVTGPVSPLNVTSPTTVTGNYKVQYRVTFDQSGAGGDFTGTVVTVDATNYSIAGLPAQFWWDQDASHSFTFASTLTVNSSKQYALSSTSGLSSVQSDTLTINTSGSVTGNYIVQNSVTFAQLGASSDFTSTLVIIDGTSYAVNALPVSLYWQLGSTHSFAFQSPLVVTANSEQYVWTNTTGLSTLQGGSINVTTFGSIIGHYKTQYYLTVATYPSGLNNPSSSGWYDSGAYADISTQQYIYGGSRYSFTGWTTSDIFEIADPTSTSTTVLMDKGKTVTANYVHQYLVTFTQSGLDSSASSTVVTVNSTMVGYGQLNYTLWVDSGGSVTYFYSDVSSSTPGKRFVLTSVTGFSSPIIVGGDTNVAGNYKTQYYLTVSSSYGTTGGENWYDSGATAYATLNTGMVDQLNGTRRVFTNWNGDASGTNYAQSDPIAMSAPKTALANWKTQYSATFAQIGSDASASGTVATVNGAPVAYGQLNYTLWVDSGGSVTYFYSDVSSSTPGKKFILIGVTGLSSPITISNPVAVTGNYKTQYQIAFSQTGVTSDFAGPIVSIDGTPYTYSTLSASFWWDSDSLHTFSFASPLIVDPSKQYNCASTLGLSTLQNDTLTISGSGGVTGNYLVEVKQQITFSQTGVDPNFTGIVVDIDSASYNVLQLPISFWWDTGSSHNFSFASPLSIGGDKQYVWTSTTGLSAQQHGLIVVSSSGSITGNYKTRYYLALATNPSGINSPSGAGWYDAGTNATISTTAFSDIVLGFSRYRFNGWATTNVKEIEDPLRSPTNVLMDEAKTVTADYAVQYLVAFNQSGVGSDFTGTVVTIDLINYNVTGLPSNATFWWDKDSVHTFAYQSPLVASANTKQYVWTSTNGLSTLQSGSITVSSSGSVMGNYNTQYVLIVLTNPGGLSPQPSRNPAGQTGPLNGWWYDASTSVTLTAQSVQGYTFNYWDVEGISQGNGVNPITVSISGPDTAKANYAVSPNALTVTINPGSATIYLGDSVAFTSTLSGGTAPYTYQWYLNGNSVPGATSSDWTFTPGSSDIYYVYIKVIDAQNNAVQSDTARIIVPAARPVGGYSDDSVFMAKQVPPANISAHLALVALFVVALSLVRRKRK
ncbi:MAG: hypothetical protein WBV70_05965, partial [Candidatus Bathyarchaeia archaeon]